MDAGGVATAACSTLLPNDVTDDPKDLAACSRDANEHMTKMRADHCGRFLVLASLPLPDIDATLNEIDCAYRTLQVDGVHMPTSAGGHWLGEPFFDPVLEVLNLKHAVVKTHPSVNPCCRFPSFVPYGGTGLVELITDTQRAISAMLFSGASARYRGIKLVWSHAGGALLGQLRRYVNVTQDPKWQNVMPLGPEYELKRHYYDVAQAFAPVTLRALKDFVPPSQILFGTDYPFRTPAETIAGIRATHVFSEAEIAGWTANAKALFA